MSLNAVFDAVAKQPFVDAAHASAMLCRVNPIAPVVVIDPRASALCISLAMFNLDRIEQTRGSRYSIL